MEQINIGYTRRKELICTEDELMRLGKNIVLLEGETIYVRFPNGSWKSKIGDGATNLFDLPFVGSEFPEISPADNGKILSVVNGKWDLMLPNARKIGTFFTDSISYWHSPDDDTDYYQFGSFTTYEQPSANTSVYIPELLSLLESATFFVVEFWTTWGTGPFVLYSGVTTQFEGEFYLETHLGTCQGESAHFSATIWRFIFGDQEAKVSRVRITGYSL